MKARIRFVNMAALVTALAVLVVACDGDNGKDGSSASQAAIDAVSARVQRDEMMSALLKLSTLELHGMDETLNNERRIDPSFVPNTRTAVRLLALTDWSSEFKAQADTIQGNAVTLLKALEAEDVQAAGDAAHELHEGEHDFDSAVWNVIARDLPPDEGGPQPPEADDEEATPAAGEPTPAATP